MNEFDLIDAMWAQAQLEERERHEQERIEACNREVADYLLSRDPEYLPWVMSTCAN